MSIHGVHVPGTKSQPAVGKTRVKRKLTSSERRMQSLYKERYGKDVEIYGVDSPGAAAKER